MIVSNSILIVKNTLLVVFNDYSKAFDTYTYRQVGRLWYKGSTKWMVSWLSLKISYIFKVSDAVSATVNVVDGTAQRSVLGPLYFITYVNDAASLIKIENFINLHVMHAF